MKKPYAFSFRYPLQHRIVRNLRVVTEKIGELEVEGQGYFNPSASVLDIFERFSVDIDSVKWETADIRPVLEVMGNMDEVYEAAVRYFASEFDERQRTAA